MQRKRRFYNLDAIISVEYRIRSYVATGFRHAGNPRSHLQKYRLTLAGKEELKKRDGRNKK